MKAHRLRRIHAVQRAALNDEQVAAPDAVHPRARADGTSEAT